MKYFFITIFSFLSIAVAAQAATISVAAPATAAIGEQIAVDVIADTGGASINSVEASLRFPSDQLAFAGYQENAGVVRFWIAPPKASNGIVSFAGGIPGGADHSIGGSGTTLTLVRLLFTVKSGGTAVIAVDRSTLLKNDGKGTALSHTASGFSISIPTTAASSETAAPVVPAVSDTTPPEAFSVHYIPRDSANGTPALLTFGTTDRTSGISTYQVKLGWGAWHDAASPYPIHAQFFSYRAMVRAVDTNGNAQISHILVPGIMPPWVLIAAVVVLGAGYYAYFVVKKKV